MKIKAKWLRIEEHTNALDYLEKIYLYLLNPDKHHYSWKWIMICLHGAMYGFAISACKGSNSESVIEHTKRGEKLIYFNTALKRCQDINWMRYAMADKVLVLNDSQKKSIKRMNMTFRNEFEHFKPKGWSIEFHDFPIIVLGCLDVIRMLSVDTDTKYRLGESKLRRTKSLIYQSKKIIIQSDLYKETLRLIEMKTQNE